MKASKTNPNVTWKHNHAPLWLAGAWLVLATIVGLCISPKLTGFVYSVFLGLGALGLTVAALGIIGGYFSAWVESRFNRPSDLP